MSIDTFFLQIRVLNFILFKITQITFKYEHSFFFFFWWGSDSSPAECYFNNVPVFCESLVCQKCLFYYLTKHIQSDTFLVVFVHWYNTYLTDGIKNYYHVSEIHIVSPVEYCLIFFRGGACKPPPILAHLAGILVSK